MKGNIILALLFYSLVMNAQSITGTWKTFDDNTGKARSYVNIWKGDNNSYYGKITKVLDVEEAKEKCIKCTGKKKNQPILGLIIIEGMKKDGDEFADGRILDPEDGNEYECKIWKEDEDTLMVRGYKGWFFRTQTWKKVTS